jgi:hypothetical protein
MNTRELRQLLEHVEDTRELILRPYGQLTGSRELDELEVVWRAARAEANLAYAAWGAQPGSDAYAAYRAAEDRADAAQDALIAASIAWRDVAKAPSGLNHHGKRAD